MDNLLPFINASTNKLSLITIDSNPEEFELSKLTFVNYILIRKDDLSSIVDDILKNNYAQINEDGVKKVKEFAQGIPLMAVLMRT